jgi:hypothetical protein
LANGLERKAFPEVAKRIFFVFERKKEKKGRKRETSSPIERPVCLSIGAILCNGYNVFQVRLILLLVIFLFRGDLVNVVGIPVELLRVGKGTTKQREEEKREEGQRNVLHRLRVRVCVVLRK